MRRWVIRTSRAGDESRVASGESRGERREGGVTQSTRDGEKGRRRKRGTWMDRMGRMKAGACYWSPKRKRPGWWMGMRSLN